MVMSNKGDTSTEYLRKSFGGGKSSVVRGAQKGLTLNGFIDGDKSVGTKRYDVTNKSLNRGRKM